MCVCDLTVRPSGEVLAHTETHLHSRSSLIFFCGFRSEQLLNGHSSSETGHWEAQRGLARVSALPNTQVHGAEEHIYTRARARSTHQVNPGSATALRVRCDHLADVLLPNSDFWRLSTLLNLTTMEDKARCTCIILELMWQQQTEVLCSVWQKQHWYVYVNSKRQAGIAACSKQVIVA